MTESVSISRSFALVVSTGIAVVDDEALPFMSVLETGNQQVYIDLFGPLRPFARYLGLPSYLVCEAIDDDKSRLH